MSNKVTVIIFAGRAIQSPIEKMMALAERAVARDLIDRALATGLVDRVIVATDSSEFAESLRNLPVLVEIDRAVFHFGSRLKEIIHDHKVDRAFYLGAGSAPLLGTQQMEALCQTLISSEGAILANNFYSSDFVAFAPATAIARIQPPDTDNNLAFALHHQAGLPNIPVRKEAGTQMDVDTPADLLVLSLHPGAGSHTRAFLRECDFDLRQLNRLMQVVVDPSKKVLIAGRVGSSAWKMAEENFACQTRVLSEERGMRASGREARGEVRSLIGYCLRSLGFEEFFHVLQEMVDGAIIDSRVIFGHLGLKPSGSDRFYSDLLTPERISDPVVRDFTRAAANAPIPVVLGGHSVVSGNLWALGEIASRSS